MKEGQADNLFNYPFTLKTTPEGLIVTYIPWGVIGDSQPIQVSLAGLSAPHTTVADYSDWTVRMSWQDSDQHMEVTAGIGMPFLYFEKESDDVVEIQINNGNVSIREEQLIIKNASHGADFVVYAPTGSRWEINGNVYSTHANNQTYWSLAMLPQTTQEVEQRATDFQTYAYVFPSSTSVSWSYNENLAELTTQFTIQTEVKEGSSTTFLQGLLPHHWSRLSPNGPQPSTIIYETVRGEMKMLQGNHFNTVNRFSGILPTLPNLTHYSDRYNPAELISKIKTLENSQLDLWTDSYNEGQLMNRLIQTARAAHEIGFTDSRDRILETIKERLENWLTYTAGEKAFLFYYNEAWTTLIGYPAGHGQDTNINDHHFHWGYFIHAAAFIEQFEPGWIDQWGPMIELLIRDAASQNRSDNQFPFLRNFSPFAGHSWANGFASFPQGNDQESTSESMQFNSSLIHYGAISGRDDIRDLGIYLYTTEQTAIEEYWFDVQERNFKPNQNYGLVSRVWGNSYDNGTFWTSDITASYGIEFYPIHGGSFYLAKNQEYVERIWHEIEQYTEILSPDSRNPNLWHDTFWKYLAFVNPSRALDLYELSPDRLMKFGVSDAQTYYWLHNLEALGTVRPDITSDDPIAAVFEKEGEKTYVAHNYNNTPKTIQFSDGFRLDVPPRQMATSKDVSVQGVLETDFLQAYPNSTISLRLNQTNGPISRVEFYHEGTLLGAQTQAPYTLNTPPLPSGVQNFWARIYEGSSYTISNIVAVQVGEQISYLGTPHVLPGTFEAGHYDQFDGGKGQNITYLDLSQGNNSNFRPEEDVDAGIVPNEGATVGWIDAGEWLEYSISVEQSGYYDLSLRYASGNGTGGGPFHLEIGDQRISPEIRLNRTSSENWDTWRTQEVNDIELTQGNHVLKVVFTQGGFNLGQMTFTRNRELSYIVPTAEAGSNRSVRLPQNTIQLDGSGSQANGAGALNYEWTQIYGPNRVVFDNPQSENPTVSNLIAGVYRLQLRVTTGGRSDTDQMYLIVNDTGNHPPVVRLTAPENNQSYRANEDVHIQANASDLDGSIAAVRFYQNDELLQEITQTPYQWLWESVPVGNYTLKAEAIDDLGEQSFSPPIQLTVEEVLECSQTHRSAQQGSFSTGYRTTFETVGSTLNITFELLDTNKSGVVAFLWQENPFQEFPMEETASGIFTRSISGYSVGDQVSFACKFAYAGGMSVTEYIPYTIGSNCNDETDNNNPTGNDNDPQEEEEDNNSPTNLTASIAEVSDTAVVFNLNAHDDSGSVTFIIRTGSEERRFTSTASQVSQYTWNGLTPETSYPFIIRVQDSSANVSEEMIELNLTTLENQSNACSGLSVEALQGTFSEGYRYEFETLGENVTIRFELLDLKSGVVAYLWEESPFRETQMIALGERRFEAVLTNQTRGDIIRLACKFAFANGMAVTTYYSYTVGDDCLEITNDDDQDGIENDQDQCPDTPPQNPVNAYGCPDDDNDGVSNEFDQCPETPQGNGVNALGCEEIIVYPNPTNGPIHIFIGQENSEILLTINNSAGLQIIQYLVRVPQSRTISLNLSFLKRGLYILNFEGNYSNFQRKVLIH